jgi:serine/threonine protein kinase
MTDTIHCPDCGLPLPPDAPQGECPRCLLRAGLESQPAVAGVAHSGASPIAVTRTSSGHAHFVPPTVAELQQRIPQYEILELIGQGGMGAVYKARQRGLERLVAIKILPFEVSQSAAFAERFSREARALAMLSHPHIVAVHDFGQAEGMCYFVMEYVAGVNLRQAIQAGKMNPAEALAIVPQICEALQFAHDEGVVHRDIKPENILIDLRGRVKIADFGLAKLLGTQTPEHSLTGTQQVMGTLRYMAPEQMFGSKEVDHRADIFSLGVVFYELLTGELPIGRFAPPSKKAGVDARLDDVVLRALEAEPAERYQHVSEMKTGVEAVAKAPVARQTATSAPSQRAAQPAASLPQPSSFVGTPYHLLLCLALSLASLWFVLYFGPPVFTMIDGPDVELLKVGRDWDLGTTVNSIFSSLVVAFIALVGATTFAWWKYREAGLQQLRDTGAVVPLPSRTTEEGDQPRFSPAALWGAILAPLSLFTLLMVAGSTLVVHRADGQSGPPLALRLVAMLLLIPGVVGLFSPFATTILGILAISQIRNAKGKLYGLPLAVFDALVYPLLVLDAVLLTIGYFLLVFIFSDVLQFTYNSPQRNFGPVLLTAVLVLPLVIILNVWLVRLTWRAAADGLNATSRPMPPREAIPRAAALPLSVPTEPRLSLAALWGAILSPAVLLPVLLIVGSVVVGKSPSPAENSSVLMHANPTWLMMPVMCAGLPGLIAPFVTTLLGVLAIGHIRRSHGKLYGLPLAVFDALLFPLLLLDLLLIWLGFLLFVGVLSLVLKGMSVAMMGPLLLTGLLVVPLVVVLDLWLIRLSWRAANHGLNDEGEKKLLPMKEPPPFQPQGAGKTSQAVVVVLVVLAIFAIPTLLAGGVLAAYFFSHSGAKPRNYTDEKWLYEPTNTTQPAEKIQPANEH